MLLTRDLIERLAPRPRSGAARQAVWDGYADALVSDAAAALLARFEITTPLRLAHLLATWAHETGGFTIVWESGAYSASRILDIFGAGRHSARVTPAEAKRLAGNGPALFERVYGLGNPGKAAELGNTDRGDGWRFRGLGIQQLTGRRDHEACAARIGCTLDALAAPINTIHAALIEWQAKGCNRYADRDDVVMVRKLVNGGRNGLADVREHLARAKRLLADADLAAGEPAIGADSADVRQLQQRLVGAGFPVGAIDGRFGRYTEAALVAFQQAHGLAPTGVADAETLAVLADAKPRRREVARDDLVARGSRTLGLWARIKTLGRLFKWGSGTTLVGEALGLEPIESIVAAAEQAKGLLVRLGELIGIGIRPGWLVAAGLVALGIVLVRWATAGEEVRVEDAASGANLGR